MSSATCALVSSRDLHWSLHASKDVKDINLSTIRMLLLADRANPCELKSCADECAHCFTNVHVPCIKLSPLYLCTIFMMYD